MILNLKKYVVEIFYKLTTKIQIDKDFYETDFYLIDME